MYFHSLFSPADAVIVSSDSEMKHMLNTLFLSSRYYFYGCSCHGVPLIYSLKWSMIIFSGITEFLEKYLLVGKNILIIIVISLRKLGVEEG